MHIYIFTIICLKRKCFNIDVASAILKRFFEKINRFVLFLEYFDQFPLVPAYKGQVPLKPMGCPGDAIQLSGDATQLCSIHALPGSSIVSLAWEQQQQYVFGAKRHYEAIE